MSQASSTSFLACVDNSHDLQKTNIECLEEGGKRDGERARREGNRNGRRDRDKQERGEKQCYQSSREWERKVETVVKSCFVIYTKDKQIASVTHMRQRRPV